MNRLGQPHFKMHPDDLGVDRIEIDVVPRYKTSGLSGDEWRVSSRVRFYRKGHLVGEERFLNIAAAVSKLPWLWLTACEWCEGPLYDAERFGLCQQAGCSEVAVVVYEIKQEYSPQGEGPLPQSELGRPRRQFCLQHAIRGDCGLEDADENYVQVQGPKPTDADIPLMDRSPSATVVVRPEAPDAD